MSITSLNDQALRVQMYSAVMCVDAKRLFPRLGKGRSMKSHGKYFSAMRSITGYCIDAPCEIPTGSIRKITNEHDECPVEYYLQTVR